jgi:uncharacterized membrane protein
LYVDPADPRLFVPKRSSIGSTVNLGHPWGWPVLALMVLLPLAAVVIALVLVG